MHPLDTNHQRVCRSQRWSGVAHASARAASAALVAAVALAASSAAQACGYHDPASASMGVLNWIYPDSLHVRTAVWMAQANGLIARREPLPAAEPQSATLRFQQMIRWRETQLNLDTVKDRIQAGLDGQPMPTTAVLLIGPMLWTRFEGHEGTVSMESHATGPVGDDVVIVTDEAVVAALAEGRITARAARAQGLVKAYGSSERVEHVAALLDRSFQLKQSPMSQTNLSMEVQ